MAGRGWGELGEGKPVTELWLAKKLRPYGIRPKTIWVGEAHAKGYLKEDFAEVFGRYVPRGEASAMLKAMGAEVWGQGAGDVGGTDNWPLPPATIKSAAGRT